MEKLKSTHNSMRFIIIIGQLFAIFPIMGLGISENPIKDLRFSWISFRFLYTFFNILGLFTFTATIIYAKLFIENKLINIFELATIAFYTSALITNILFLKLARNWSNVMKKWLKVDNSMKLTYGWPKGIDFRLKLISTILLIAALIETTIGRINKIMLIITCKNEKISEGPFEFYTISSWPEEVFQVFNYTFYLGIILQILNITATFAWTYLDVFLIVLSTILAMRFEQITKRLKIITEQKIYDIKIWKSIREDYNRLSFLTYEINEEISLMVLLSYATNLSFIVYQLFNSFRNMNDILDKGYFYFSFAFLLIRAFYVSLYGAWLNDESKEPINILFSSPSEIFNIEISRFLEQLQYDKVCFNGKDFFSVTKEIILSIAGAIVTYELVVIQSCGGGMLKEIIVEDNLTKIC